jgi:hypothetical protein
MAPRSLAGSPLLWPMSTLVDHVPERQEPGRGEAANRLSLAITVAFSYSWLLQPPLFLQERVELGVGRWYVLWCVYWCYCRDALHAAMYMSWWVFFNH